MKDPLLEKTLDGRFEIRSRIGEGGMSVVYIARDLVQGGEAAIKILHEHLEGDDDFIARFRQEAKSAQRFSHPNAVKVVHSGEDSGRLYLAMEYCGGRSLKRIIRDEAPLSPGRAADLASQILAALGAAHAAGIIHRDLKPENIRVERRGKVEIVKVLDFGVAKYVGTEELGEMTGAVKTKTGVVFGTPKYMAPEQIMGEEIDARIDIYACGVILYEMLVGVPPFESEDLYGYVTKHLREAAPAFKVKDPTLEIPSELETLVMRTLEKDREERPADADALRQGLDPYVVRARESRWKRFGPAAVALTLGGAAGGAAAWQIASEGPGVELGVGGAALGLLAGIGYLAFGRTSNTNLVLRLVLVLVGAAAAEMALSLTDHAHWIWGLSATLAVGLIFAGFSIARTFTAGWLRPVLATLAGLAGGALVPVLRGGSFVRLWQIGSPELVHLGPALSVGAIGAAFGLAGLLVPKESG